MPLRVDTRADDNDKHEFDINFLLYHKGKLYSGADDGKVMAWAKDLKKITEVQSNPCSVYCLAANDSCLYSCSNEGTVKAFELDSLKEKGVITQDDQTEFWRIACDQDYLYTGDHQGSIKIFKKDKFYGGLNVADPIKDMVLYKNLLFTVNMDIIITDLKLEGEKLQYGTRTTFNGRAPITLLGDKYIAFASREAMDIMVHENSESSCFKSVTKVEGAHERVINALVGVNWNNQLYLFSGGWDKVLKKWKLEGDNLKLESSCEVEFVINALAVGEQGEIYVGGGDGHILRVQDE